MKGRKTDRTMFQRKREIKEAGVTVGKRRTQENMGRKETQGGCEHTDNQKVCSHEP